MTDSKDLLLKLGIRNYTKRHLQIIEDFLESKETSANLLLDELGSWDEYDLKITEDFLKNR